MTDVPTLLSIIMKLSLFRMILAKTLGGNGWMAFCTVTNRKKGAMRRNMTKNAKKQIHSTVGNLWIPFAFSTQLASTPLHAGLLSLELGRPTMEHALTTYLLTASLPRSSSWEPTSCQRWRVQTTALSGGSWAVHSFLAQSLPPSVLATCQSLQVNSRNSHASSLRWTKNQPNLSRKILCLVLKKRRKGEKI